MALPDIVRAELSRAADPRKAGMMQRYMKSTMPFLGIQAPVRRKICAGVFAENRLPTARAWRAACLALWRRARYREERYAAIQLSGCRAYDDFQTLDAVSMYEEMIVDGAWWDYVDEIAAHRIGMLLSKYPDQLSRLMLQWSRSKDMWKQRTAILCQIRLKSATDLKLLYRCIEPALTSQEFFLRKAIGWALRDYARTNPAEVRRYVEKRRSSLSPLSRREAMKHMTRVRDTN
jgi:3-methyladenine DNA glycosylase AlkD